MNIVQVKIDIHRQVSDNSATVPIAVPDLEAVRALATQLHRDASEYRGMHWGWPVHYDPELREDAAEFQIPDGQGGYRTEVRPFWSPASFTIGESGVWFYSLLWENGTDSAPVEFMDDRNLTAAPKSEFKQRYLNESAELYAVIYAEDTELQELTDAAVEGWPE